MPNQPPSYAALHRWNISSLSTLSLRLREGSNPGGNKAMAVLEAQLVPC